MDSFFDLIHAASVTYKGSMMSDQLCKNDEEVHGRVGWCRNRLASFKSGILSVMAKRKS
ncbi:hypothetical protein Leryth_004092 [Lithospermum erythrorhizon]|nr:hypothetical protein Leryth_004092 [Lithospermum erythrorhizon]